MDTITAPAKFAWSYSRLTGYELCPRRYNEVTVKKAWEEEESPQLKWGNDVHAAMATALRTNQSLPDEFQLFQPWIDKIRRTPGKLLVEEQCRWAINRQYKQVTWMAKDVWLRAIADAVKLDNDVAMLVDFKTGKSMNADPVQLDLVSLVLLASFPKLQCVRSDFIFLNEDHQITQILYRDEAPDKWAEIIPRVKKFEAATQAGEFPPQPGRFCKSWCPVRSCENWGKSF